MVATLYEFYKQYFELYRPSSLSKFSRFFFAGAMECEIDKQGRFLITSNLREFAGLEKEVIIVGVLNKIEIWSKERWEKNDCYDNMDEVAEHMSEVGLSF